MKKRLYRNDIILNLIIVVLCIAVPVCFAVFSDDESKLAVISVDGQEVESMPLEKDGTFSVNGLTVIVSENCAFITESDCPDKVCVDSKKASNVGDSIICVPNKVSVRIVGKEEKGADVVAG